MTPSAALREADAVVDDLFAEHRKLNCRGAAECDLCALVETYRSHCRPVRDAAWMALVSDARSEAGR